MGNWKSNKRRICVENYLKDVNNPPPNLNAEQDEKARDLVLTWNNYLRMMKNPSKDRSEWYAKNV